MKSKIRNIIFALTTVTLMGSCSDFLDIEDKAAINSENFPKTVEQCELLLNSCYAGTHTVGLYSFYWFPMGMYLYDHTSDLFGAFDERTSSAENNTIVTNRYITQMYIDIFRMIRSANETMTGIERYREIAPANESAQLDYIYAQALFFRALGYWHGQIFFEVDPKNGLGLPIFRQSPSTLEAMSISRNTTGEVFQFMIEDLKKCAEMLKGKKEKYKVGEWAAKGLLAKVYMQAGSDYWQDAKTVMEDIINNSGKSLVRFDVYEKMFFGSPYEANEFNSESLYELDMISNARQNGPWAGYTMGSGMPMVFSPALVNLSVTGAINDPWKISAETGENEYTFPGQQITLESGWINSFVHDVNIRRFGYAGDPTPLLELNPAFDNKSDITIDNYPFRLKDPNHKKSSLDARALADPRLTVCASQPWVDNAIDDKGKTTLYNRAGAIAGKDMEDLLGWWLKKFTNLNGVENAATDKIHGKNYSSDANIHIVRLADIYLLYAEVMRNLKDEATALKYVNAVHRRAYGGDPNPNAADASLDYKSLTGPTKTLADGGNDHLKNDVIKYERWAELFAEGQWWWDVRRWKIGEQETRVYKEVSAGTVNLVFRGDAYYVQPIPQYELDRNKGIKQSTGY